MIHGLGSAPAYTTSSEDAEWASWDSAGNSVLGTACDSNALTWDDPHSLVLLYIPVQDEIDDWLGIARRRSLQRGSDKKDIEEHRVDVFYRDAKTEAEIGKKRYDLEGEKAFGTFTNRAPVEKSPKMLAKSAKVAEKAKPADEKVAKKPYGMSGKAKFEKRSLACSLERAAC